MDTKLIKINKDLLHDMSRLVQDKKRMEEDFAKWCKDMDKFFNTLIKEVTNGTVTESVCVDPDK